MNIDLQNRVALITGGSHGVGLEIAKSLAKEGCYIIITGRDENRLIDACKEITKYNRFGLILYSKSDATKIEDIKNTINTIIHKQHLKTIDILINNVGGGGRWGTTFEDTPDETIYEVQDKNVMAALRFTREVLPYMKKRKWGRVITISSTSGREYISSKTWFNMTKASEIALMKSLSQEKEYTRNNITFNTVAPGPLMIKDTGWDKISKEDPEEFKRFIDNTPQGKLPSAEDVANIVTFLCSDKASSVNGSCIVIDGGIGKSF